MRKVLVIMNAVNVNMGGGIIQVIFNCKKALEQVDECQLEFAINTSEDTNIPQILGKDTGCFHYLPNKKRHFISYIRALDLLLRKGYDVIHVHGSSSTMMIELIVAWNVGIPIRIAHSHNSKSEYPFLNMVLNPIFRLSYTKAAACSEKAGKWLYKKDRFTIIDNVIDCEKFRFDKKKRADERKKLKIRDDQIVVGHVGNFVVQKNHEFIINIFSKYLKKKEGVLLLIGDGALIDICKEQVNKYQIEKNVFFLGLRDDVDMVLQAMDLFIFPSKWEGFPLSLLEAQAAGLPCILADNISSEICINKSLCKRLPLEEEKWIDALVNTQINNERENAAKVIKDTGHDINDFQKKLINLYELDEVSDQWI